ncbi:MAG TPA: hypothetical protein VFL83_01840 [Anaeromyxobacter sp.]|nr:hypothetical protein [Anaeromyxobacter sp.]
MPRNARTASLDVLIREAAADVVARITPALAKQFSELVKDGVSKELSSGVRVRGGGSARRARRGDITRWVADNRARRVPNFVIEATGLDTKKKIVAKYGPGAAFEKGKPTPKPKS